jgi:hypothetical protein
MNEWADREEIAERLTARGFIKEQNRRAGNELASDRNTSLFTTRNRPLTCGKVIN